jgi:hypothetical protein
MGQVTFNKSIGERSILPTAGKYGQGLDYDADVTLDKFEWNTTENLPGYAKSGDGKHFAFFLFKVIHKGKTVFLRHHEQIDEGSGSDAEDILRSMGIEVNDNGDDTFSFDPDSVAPRKVTGIEVGDPVQSKKDTSVYYSGNLTGVKVIG